MLHHCCIIYNYCYHSNDVFRYIVADCDSVEVIAERQRWLHDSPEAAIAETLKAGEFSLNKIYKNFIFFLFILIMKNKL